MISIFPRLRLGFLFAGLAACLIAAGLLLTFTNFYESTSVPSMPLPPLPTLAFTPIARPSLTPVLTITSKPPQINAKAVYLLDADTGKTLDDWQGEYGLPMASTTKIMTALLAIQGGHLDQLVTVHQDAIDEVSKNNGANSAGLHVGDRVPLRELLYGLMLPSGNDAAIAIADAMGGGSCSKFVHMMNVEASRLDLFSTNYTSPDGLIPCRTDPSGNFTTAYDLARLARYAMRLTFFAKIVQTPFLSLPRNDTHPTYAWTNTNDLLGGNPAAYPGATGIKTGHTDQAGECLVFSATRSNHHLIGILLYDTKADPNRRFQDAHALLDWGFSLSARVLTI